MVFNCPFHNIHFVDKRTYIDHLKRYNNNVLECWSCEAIFVENSKLNIHYQQNHSDLLNSDAQTIINNWIPEKQVKQQEYYNDNYHH